MFNQWTHILGYANVIWRF